MEKVRFRAGVNGYVLMERCTSGFNLPDEAGDVVAGARPIGSSGAEPRAGQECGAVIGDFGEIETVGGAVHRASAATDFRGQGTHTGRTVSPIIAVLPRRVSAEAGRIIAAAGTAAEVDAGVV